MVGHVRAERRGRRSKKKKKNFGPNPSFNSRLCVHTYLMKSNQAVQGERRRCETAIVDTRKATR